MTFLDTVKDFNPLEGPMVMMSGALENAGMATLEALGDPNITKDKPTLPMKGAWEGDVPIGDFRTSKYFPEPTGGFRGAMGDVAGIPAYLSSPGGVPSTGRDPGQKTPIAQQTATAVKSTTPPMESGVVAPDPGRDPAGYQAAHNANKAADVGNLHGEVAKAPDTSIADARAAIFKDIGQNVAYEQEGLEPWYESPTFYRGLISFGLNLLSGNDLGASFNAAGKYYDQERGREQRAMWRDDMLADGYNPMEIERYIETGDNKVLTDPLEKATQMLAYEKGQVELAKSKYEMNPDRLAKLESRADEEWKMKVAEHEAELAAKQDASARGWAAVRAAQAKADAKAAEDESGKPGTVAEANRQEGAAQMQGALDGYEQLAARVGADPSAIKDLTSEILAGDNSVMKFAAKKLASDSAKLTEAEDSFMDVYNKKMSGAAMPVAEKATRRGYLFPTASDDEFTTQQKKNRRRAMAYNDPYASDEYKAAINGMFNGVVVDIKPLGGNSFAIQTSDGKWKKVER